MKRIITILFLMLIITLLMVTVYAQQPTPPKEEEVVKVTTNLVQVDAVVTDKDGNLVTNLTANDFEIWQDGKPQTITNVSFINRTVNSAAANQTQTAVAEKTDKNVPIPPTVSTHSAEFGRILTFLVDDGNCDSTQVGISAIKDGLEKFVNEQMLPNDSVAIYQTHSGNSLLQQYTSDKSQLLSIIKKIRWYPPKGGCLNGTGDDYVAIQDDSTLKGEGSFGSERDRSRKDAINDIARNNQVAGFISVARYIINGLQRVGGRKILFLMSDSLPVSNGKKTLPTAFSDVRDLAALANRASVVINSIDVRGSTNQMIEARDNVSGLKKVDGMMDTGPIIADRIVFDESRQSGLALIALETGGKFYKNINNLEAPVQKALKAEKGYYLIAYDPEEETFKGKTFHKIEIKLKRPDLISSSRSGFYGVTDDALRPKPRTGDSELYDVLSSPLPNADMNIRLSAYFVNTADNGNFIHALLYIDGKDITFTNGANGNKKAIFDIVAVTLGEKGEVIDDSNSTQTVQIPADKVASIQRNGLIYTVDVPVKKAGVYTFRTALREATSKRLGSSSQTIEVPDLKKNSLYLSGLTMSGVDGSGKMLMPETAKAKNGFSTVSLKAIPAIRQFHRNTIVGYAYSIYNAKIDATNKQPKLSIQTNLYSDGKLLSEGNPHNAEIQAQKDMTRINDYTYLRLNSQLPIGDYTLQVIIKDLLTNQTTSQLIDFEVVN